MRFDKETVIAIVLCTVFLLGWEPFCRKMGWTGTRKKTVPVEERVEAQSPDRESSAAKTESKEDGKGDNKLLHTAKILHGGITKKLGKVIPFYDDVEPDLPADKKFPFVQLETKHCVYEFNPQRGCISKITLKKFLNAGRTAPIVLTETPGFQPGILALGNSGRAVKIIESSCPDKDTYRLVRQMRHPTGSCDFVQTREWKVVGDYVLDYTISAQLLSDTDKDKVKDKDKDKVEEKPTIALLKKLPYISFYMGELPGWSQLSGDVMRADPLEFCTCSEKGEIQKINVSSASDEKLQQISRSPLKWAAVANKYFAMILIPDQPSVFRGSRLELEKKDSYSAAIASLISPQPFDSAMRTKLHVRYYAGPRESEYLKQITPDAAELVHYAWGPINTLAKALLWILEFLNGITGSYGWSIIILTLLVRTVFLPLTMKGNASMQKMAKVQPRVKELKEKYQDNPQVFNAKMLELYKTEGVNPLGGCFPILVQIPVFFALYAALEGALQLRHVPFLWVTNLAGPDTVWSCTLPFSFFGIAHIHLNPLVLIMTALMVVQQHIVPNTMEPAQRKMMALMPLFMLLFLYELPSGLTLYWTVSNIFSILQMLWQQRQSKIAAAAAGV